MKQVDPKVERQQVDRINSDLTGTLQKIYKVKDKQGPELGDGETRGNKMQKDGRKSQKRDIRTKSGDVVAKIGTESQE